MWSLKSPGRRATQVSKSFFTVGGGTNCDLDVGKGNGILFSLQAQTTSLFLIPGPDSLSLNGKKVTKKTEIFSCDVIESSLERFVLLDEFGGSPNEKDRFASQCLRLLEKLSNEIQSGVSFSSLSKELLDTLVSAASAEVGYLVTDMRKENEWEVLATSGVDPDGTRRDLISNTILSKAIREKTPVFLESIVGHALARHASLLGAQVFSVACLPLLGNGRAFGGVYLYTKTPGKVINVDRLPELTILAAQSALLIASRWALEKKTSVPTQGITYDATLPNHPMAQALLRVDKLAPTPLSIIIFGETGVGKELIAREIHRKSQLKGPFVALNCAAIPPTLIESVLFGHCKGSFTGATKDQVGKIVEANSGTLFLDEIGELPFELQAKLLRFLQEKCVEPIGGGSKKVEVRILTATHRNLGDLIEKGTFRADLFYRLNGAEIKLPPLRERKGDIPILSQTFLRQGYFLSQAALEKCLAYSWPGNVRELEQVLARSSALSDRNEIGPDEIELSQRTNEALTGFDGLDLKKAQREFALKFIKRALEQSSGNRTEAAAKLGISERTLYRMMEPAESV